MNNVTIRLLWLVFGISIGILAVLYRDVLLRPETPVVSAHPPSMETNVEELISINNEVDAVARRRDLIAFVWGETGLPTHVPAKIDLGIFDERFASLGNLKQIDRLTIQMEWGLTSTAYHFLPTQANNKLLIYHRGHDGDFAQGIPTIRFFLEKGFSVIALSMPMEAPNNRPVVDLKGIGKIQLAFHEQLKLLKMKSGHPVQVFLTPVALSLNYAKKFGYDPVYMTGVSGGGWTTTIYAALDPRITRSYPVAGSLPVHLRSNAKVMNTAQRSPDWGDYEQTIPELYTITNYLDLYVLGSYGSNRRQVQILNKYDPCCFGGDAYKTYEEVVNRRVALLESGSFAVYLDTKQKLHEISDQALNVMLTDINTQRVISQR